MVKHSSRQLATHFQELFTEEKNLVALVPVLDAISRPGLIISE